MNNPYKLDHGSHHTAEDGKCAMEWVAYLAGEKHSACPVCVSPLLRYFCVGLNDALPDDQRQRMRPYLARTIGTADDGLDEQRRWMCVDWLVREHVPAWLELVSSLTADAASLRSLPPILTSMNAQLAMVDLTRARVNAEWAVPVRTKQRQVYYIARAAIGSVGGNAMRALTGSAACSTVRIGFTNSISITVLALQDSMLRPGGLLDRMLPTELLAMPVVSEWREVCEVS